MAINITWSSVTPVGWKELMNRMVDLNFWQSAEIFSIFLCTDFTPRTKNCLLVTLRGKRSQKPSNMACVKLALVCSIHRAGFSITEAEALEIF